MVGDIRTGEDKQMVEEFKLLNPEAAIIVTGVVTSNDLPVYY
jgi:hypothetical protein